MEFLIVTGLSGAGKSRAVDALEDIGFYCVDNLPPVMISVFYDLCLASQGMPKKVAVVTDARGGEFFKDLKDALELLESQGRGYKILFLDAKEHIIVNRYQETRRKHPLSESVNGSLNLAVKLEIDMLAPVKRKADFIIDTSGMKPQDMKIRVSELFAENTEKSMMVHCISFGFKHGMPLESDLVFDVRCLPNPFYYDDMREKTGLDDIVYDFVMSKDESVKFREKIIDMLDFLVPLYVREGKSQLVIAIGCTGGHHRSVAFAQHIHEYMKEKGLRTSVTHRDITK